ncbi:hypothetical protein VaNZ11_016938 [Volvox africanus]|uniref:ENTH domain-containing protein n=1 Tax=Volvox africanus TaxID=51714 RepID=A0ABQ5SNS2_9CHLO|nr:hypothetical protein VaNZ11_016938 [Volvox africanus]
MNINFNSVLNTLAAKAKALALNVTDIELKVLEATNEEPWGPHGKDMQEIARAAEDPEKYNLIMNVISERLQMRDENWRLCYKGLLLMEYMVKHGPWRVVEELARSVSSLERLRDDFEYKDAQGRDHGINVRQRAGELAALVCNTERVRQEREKAARNANKYKGVSSSDVRGGFGGLGSTNYSSSSGGGGGGGGGYGYSGFGGGGFGGGTGGFQGQGFGTTESVHKPNSLHNRTGSGSNHSAGTGPSGRREEGGGFRTAGGGAEEAEDPFEATRKRIERLKAEGALQEPPAAGAPPGLADPASASAKIPKKLSDVKINPAVAATFASISIPSSSSAGNLVKLAPPPSSKPSASSQQQQYNDNNNDNSAGIGSLDLFAEQPSISQTTQGSLQHQGTSATSAGLDPWNAAFGLVESSAGSALGAAAAQDPFADFASAAPAAVAAPAAASSAGFDILLGGGVSSTGSGTTSTGATGGTNSSAPAPPAKQPVRAALPFDAFSELSDPSPAPIAGHMSTGLSARPATPNAVSSPDPFAAIASSSASLAPPLGAVAFRPAPAADVTASDPFSALSASRAAPPAPVMATLSAAKPAPAPAPAPAVCGPLPFDLFASPAATPPVRPPQPAAPAAPASDPFAALAASSTPAPVPMVAFARPAAQPQHVLPAAAAPAPFDPFSSAPAQPPVLSRPAAATPPFGAMAATPPPPAAPAAGSFDDFFGTSSPGQNGHFVAAPKPPGVTTAAATSATGDPFTTSAFTAFARPPPLPQQQPTATVSPAIATAHAVSTIGTQMAMNKSGAAHGAAGHKAHDPFAGLGF